MTAGQGSSIDEQRKRRQTYRYYSLVQCQNLILSTGEQHMINKGLGIGRRDEGGKVEDRDGVRDGAEGRELEREGAGEGGSWRGRELEREGAGKIGMEGDSLEALNGLSDAMFHHHPKKRRTKLNLRAVGTLQEAKG